MRDKASFIIHHLILFWPVSCQTKELPGQAEEGLCACAQRQKKKMRFRCKQRAVRGATLWVSATLRGAVPIWQGQYHLAKVDTLLVNATLGARSAIPSGRWRGKLASRVSTTLGKAGRWPGSRASPSHRQRREVPCGQSVPDRAQLVYVRRSGLWPEVSGDQDCGLKCQEVKIVA